MKFVFMKAFRKYRPFLLSACLAAQATVANAQALQVVQVVTKKISKEFVFKEGFEVNIDGDKAEVYIETWSQPLIQVQLEIASRHPSKDIAQRDLEYMQYLAQRVKNKIYLRNFISVPEGEPETAARLSVSYRIKVPAECPVYLKTNYGIADIENLSNRLRINSRFSQIGLQNIQGWMDVNTFFGNITGEKLDGNVAITARRTDITLKELSGRFDINAQYGLIKLFAAAGLLDLNLRADHSQVFLYAPDLARYHYSLSAQNSRLSLPKGMNFSMNETTPGIKKLTFRPKSEFYPNISISVSFGELFLGR
jgi:hypothetical protein